MAARIVVSVDPAASLPPHVNVNTIELMPKAGEPSSHPRRIRRKCAPSEHQGSNTV
jgi:hypothetical protein